MDDLVSVDRYDDALVRGFYPDEVTLRLRMVYIKDMSQAEARSAEHRREAASGEEEGM